MSCIGDGVESGRLLHKRFLDFFAAPATSASAEIPSRLVRPSFLGPVLFSLFRLSASFLSLSSHAASILLFLVHALGNRTTNDLH